MKKLNLFMLLIAFALTLFVCLGTTVNAEQGEIIEGDGIVNDGGTIEGEVIPEPEPEHYEVKSLDDMKALLEGKSVTYSGTTITLNENVTIDKPLEILAGEYTLNLNGKTLKVVPHIIITEAKVTIVDATKKGVIDTEFVGVDEKATLIINQGIFKVDRVDEYDGEKFEINCVIDNLGTLVVNYAEVDGSIGNSGKMTIENAKVPFLHQFGTATIKNGEYECMLTTVDYETDTKIYGGTFKGSLEGTIIIQSEKWIDDSVIRKVVADDMAAVYSDVKVEPPQPNYSECYTVIYSGNVSFKKDIETYSDVFKEITKDGNIVLSALPPKTIDDSDFLLTSAIKKLLKNDKYELMAYCYVEKYDEEGEPINYNPERVMVSIYNREDYDNTFESHIVKVKYLEASDEKVKTVNSVLSRMKDHKDYADFTIANVYRLDDLHLINYLFANTGEQKLNSDQALNFAKELIEATGGANISFEFEPRNGGANPESLYRHSSGQVIVYYDGEAYTSRFAGLTTSHVLYIPDTTADTDEAYIAAALKRIKDYMGKDTKIDIKAGGTLDSISDEYESYNEHNLFDSKTAKTGNYYVVTINGKSYNFAICEKPAGELTAPKYVGSNLGSNVVVKTNVTTVPLDTTVTVKEVKNDTIKKALGTSTYAAYDISLYSNAKATSITKLTNGKFEVSMPIPSSLKDKKVTVYYVSDKGVKEKVKDIDAEDIKNGIVTFETNHFSTYAVAEQAKDVTPGTGIKSNMHIVALVSMISFAGYIMLRHKRQEQN